MSESAMALWKEMSREPSPEWQAHARHMVDVLLEAHPVGPRLEP